jgi:hypothetical protein
MMLGWIGGSYVIPNVPPNQPFDLVPNATFAASLNGNITYNSSTGVVTLLPGKPYRITARLSANFMQNNGFSNTYHICDVSNNPLTPNAEGLISSHTGASTGTEPSVVDLIFIPSSQLSCFKLRVVASNGSCVLNPARCSIVIQSIY